MSRQDEVEKIEKLLLELEDHSLCRIAAHLVDNGIGTKDRFEIDFKRGNKLAYMSAGVNRKIKPIEYKKEEDEG